MKSNIPAVVAPVIADPSAKVERRSLLRDLGDSGQSDRRLCRHLWGSYRAGASLLLVIPPLLCRQGRRFLT